MYIKILVFGRRKILKFYSSTGFEKCTPSQFQCNNGVCLDPSAKCNGQDDCGDGSDEIDCGMAILMLSVH